MRLLPLEQRVIEDLVHWYGPVGSRRHQLAVRAVAAWMANLRVVLATSRVSRHWRPCEGERPHSPLEGCWRTSFSPQDMPGRQGAPRIAGGPRNDRIIVDVIEHEGEAAIRVLAIGPKYAGRGEGRREWVYVQAERRRCHQYERR